MAVIQSPSADLASIYRPIIWRTEQTNANPILYALCTVEIDGNIQTIKKAPFETVGTTYRFQFDWSQLLVEATAPLGPKSSFFPGIIYTFSAVDNTDGYKAPTAVVTYYEQDPATGLPVELAGVTDNLGGPTCAIITVQQQEDYQLSRFLNAPADWLSWGLQNEEVGLSDYRPATFVDAGQARPYLRFVSQLVVSPIDINLSYLPSYSLRTVTLGPRAIMDATGLLSQFLAPWYSITPGYYTTAGDPSSFVASHQPATFRFIDKCKHGRLIYLNRLGGAEALSIKGRRQESEEISSIEVKTPLPFDGALDRPFNVSQRGRQRLQVQGTKTVQLWGQAYNANNNLLEDLRKSPEVYLQDGKNLQAVTVQDAELITADTRGLQFVQVTLNISQDSFIQR